MDWNHGGDLRRAPLTEQHLKDLSRHIKDLVPDVNESYVSDDDINKLNRTFETIFAAAENSSISASHRVAAWNTLCALIDQCMHSSSSVLHNLLWFHGIWERAFSLYVDHAHKARPKSSKQLLTTLSTALSRKDGAFGIKKTVSNRLVEGIVSADQDNTKPYLLALAKFLNRDVISLTEILSSLGKSDNENHKDGLASVQDILYLLFETATKGSLGSAVSQVVSIILDKVALNGNLHGNPTDIHAPHSDQQAAWVQPLEQVVDSHDISVDELWAHVLPTLFKRDLDEYILFLNRHGLRNLHLDGVTPCSETDENAYSNSELLYTALRTGKELGLLYEYEDPKISRTSSSLLIPVRIIGRLLSQSSPRARITGLSMLITSHVTTRPFTTSTLGLLRRHLHVFFADTDPNFRSEVFGLMQRLIDRLRSITSFLTRNMRSYLEKSPHGDSNIFTILESHRNILKWLLNLLEWELRPTASYQRHISALNTLYIVARSGLDTMIPTKYWSKSALGETKWPFHLSVVTAQKRSLLLDLLLNPFEDVRQTSWSILEISSSPSIHNASESSCTDLSKTIHRAEELMLLTGRADQADGVARLYALLSENEISGHSLSKRSPNYETGVLMHLVKSLERMLDIAKSNLSTAVIKYPMHGLLTSLRYVIHRNASALEVEGVLVRLTSCLHETWAVVKPVLCQDAPEGYAPDATEDEVDNSTKDILSYCWRGLKESSLLLEAIVSSGKLDSRGLVDLSDLCFTQLAELRHRGAFSTVAQTWTTCCLKSATLQCESGQSVPELCYEKVLAVLTNKTTINTRRSAGLPALLCGLLVAEKTGALFLQAFNDLSSIARDPVSAIETNESSLPQVHALNCMKDILKNTRLREHSESYVSPSLQLAAASLRSPAWAIRNCGLMLFRAIIDRLLGTNEVHLDDDRLSSRRFTANEQPQLLDTILNLLSRDQAFAQDRFEGIFPALQLLQCVYIPENRYESTMEAVRSLSASKSWHIRAKVARTYAALVPVEEVKDEIGRLLNITGKDQNALHGLLLCVKHVVRKLLGHLTSSGSRKDRNLLVMKWRQTASFDEVADILSSARHLFYENSCPVTKAAYIDVLAETYKAAQGGHGSPVETRRIEPLQNAQILLNQEIQHFLSAQYCDEGHAILRTALAGAFAHDLRLRTDGLPKEETVALILLLGRADSDTCVRFFQTYFARSTSLSNDANPTIYIVLRACSAILSNDFDLNLKCEVQRLLLDLTDPFNENFSRDFAMAFLKVCSTATSPFVIRCNQQYADQWLELTAIVFQYHFDPLKSGFSEIAHDLVTWTKCWQSAFQHEQSLFSREAAARAISRIRRFGYFVNHNDSTLFRQLCLGVYDLLNDDDESIRILASQTSSLIVDSQADCATERSFEPIRASQKLTALMLRKYRDDEDFVKEAFLRAFGILDTAYSSVDDQLRTMLTNDDALFAEEKQNLYVDDAREVKLWSQVILNLSSGSIAKSLVRQLALWVSEGIDALINQAVEEMDGALGWSSKPAVFALGLQVIYGAEVLLHIVENGVKLPIRPSHIRARLCDFSTAAARQDLNPLWRREIDRLLTSAVLAKLRYSKMLLERVSTSLGAV